ncbi:hypothetical protein WJX84_011010 [Apatococcus fuscideae]|uniref:Transcription initiation factor TFIID subunit 2 n=1 Tax=Apatococcus fuscideae TaxID=2026836 RepID=A0AAW1SWE2_9CHLO
MQAPNPHPQVLTQHLKICVDTERQLVFGTTEIKLLCARTSSQVAMREIALSIRYRVKRPASGLRFFGKYAFTDMQVRRARAWFPCINTPQAVCPFEMQITVAADQIAVASGRLDKQTWSADERQRTFFYSLPFPTPACHVGLSVGPFANSYAPAPLLNSLQVSDNALNNPMMGQPANQATITHFGPQSQLPELSHSTKVFPLIFNFYMQHLGCQEFPFGTLNQAFIPVGDGLPTAVAGAGVIMLPDSALVHSRTIEQAVDLRLLMARMLAEQWFGFFMRPKTAADAWLVQGLAGHLEEKFIQRYMGRNELEYRRWRQRQAIYLADDGQAPPLYVKVPEAYPWGAWHGTEGLGSCELRRWKATAVINMLEAKGEEAFKKVLQDLQYSASFQNKTGNKNQDKRAISTKDFFGLLKGKGLLPRGLGVAFVDRWVTGAGCPRITAAFALNKKKTMLELALRQQGSETTRQAAVTALSKEKDATIGLIKVSLQESQADPVDHPVDLGVHSLLLKELKLNKKDLKPGKKKRKKAEAEGEEEDESPEDTEAGHLPLWWVRVDRFGEWLADTRVLQGEQMWTLQLQRGRDVSTQAAAVAGLAAMQPATFGIANALQACLQNPAIFCRIRIDAAMALGETADLGTNSLMGLQALLQAFRERLIDPATSEVKTNDFSDVSQYYIDRALPMAIARVRDIARTSPPEAVDALVDALIHEDNRGNLYDDCGFLVGLLQASGHLVPHNQQMMDRVLGQLNRYLQREQVLPSFQSLVGCACITSLARLAATPAASHTLIARARSVCSSYAETEAAPLRMRMAAKLAGVALQSAGTSLDATLSAALEAATDCGRLGWTGCRLKLLGMCSDAVQQQLARQRATDPPQPSASMEGSGAFRTAAAASEAPNQGGAPAPDGPAPLRDISASALKRIHALMLDPADPRLRHRAFQLLQRIGDRPPYISAPVPAAETSLQSPAGDVARKAKPATSAMSQGVSLAGASQGGPAGDEGTSHIRVRLGRKPNVGQPGGSSSLQGSPSIASQAVQGPEGAGPIQATPGTLPPMAEAVMARHASQAQQVGKKPKRKKDKKAAGAAASTAAGLQAAGPLASEAERKRLKAEKRDKRRQEETPEQRAERKRAKKDKKERKRGRSDMPTPSGASSPTDTVNASVQQGMP